jgi:multiple sugar transport system ATP-binding protein
MASITLDHVHKRYPNGFVAAHDLSLEVAHGELLVLVGPSGSGKSTMLRVIAGLEPVTSGRVYIAGRDVTDLPPRDRDVAMVFQSYALYPHMTVRENLAFALTVRKRPRAEVNERVSAVAESLGLSILLDRRPAQLSGGQRQRVALGRAIVREPLAFLLDEPLSNLDARLRLETRAGLARLHRQLGVTMVYVTHDQTEAMTLGTRVAVMHEGVLQQVAPPMTLYKEPSNMFVAGFIGSPAMNFVRGRARRAGGGSGGGRAWNFEGSGLSLSLDIGGDVADRPLSIGVRPQELSLVPGASNAVASVDSAATAAAWPGVVTLIELLGSEQLVHVTAADADDIVVVAPASQRLAIGDRVSVRVPREALHVFDVDTGARLTLRDDRSFHDDRA